VEVLELDEVDHVGYVGLEVDLGRGEVHSFGEAGEGGGVDVVVLLSQLPGDLLPAPSSQPAAADEHVGRHSQALLVIKAIPNAPLRYPENGPASHNAGGKPPFVMCLPFYQGPSSSLSMSISSPLCQEPAGPRS
jgi:hypothetical protein